MACECKDENGSLLNLCLGTCQEAINTINMSEHRINFELTISQEIKTIIYKIDELGEKIHHLPRLIMDGYRQGFEDGFGAGKDELNY